MSPMIIHGLLFLFGAGSILFLYLFMKETGREMSWWKWVISILWLLFFYFSIAIIGTFVGEGEPQAVLPGILFFGAFVIVTGVIVYRLVISGSLLPRKN